MIHTDCAGSARNSDNKRFAADCVGHVRIRRIHKSVLVCISKVLRLALAAPVPCDCDHLRLNRKSAVHVCYFIVGRGKTADLYRLGILAYRPVYAVLSAVYADYRLAEIKHAVACRHARIADLVIVRRRVVAIRYYRSLRRYRERSFGYCKLAGLRRYGRIVFTDLEPRHDRILARIDYAAFRNLDAVKEILVSDLSNARCRSRHVQAVYRAVIHDRSVLEHHVANVRRLLGNRKHGLEAPDFQTVIGKLIVVRVCCVRKGEYRSYVILADIRYARRAIALAAALIFICNSYARWQRARQHKRMLRAVI